MADPWEMPKGPFWTPARLYSLVILIAEFLLASLLVGPDRFDRRIAGYITTPSIVGLLCIWFPEQLSTFRGYVGLGRFVDRETPEELLFYAGWVALLLPFLLWLVLRFSAG